jgi:hypothetical protein
LIEDILIESNYSIIEKKIINSNQGLWMESLITKKLYIGFFIIWFGFLISSIILHVINDIELIILPILQLCYLFIYLPGFSMKTQIPSYLFNKLTYLIEVLTNQLNKSISQIHPDFKNHVEYVSGLIVILGNEVNEKFQSKLKLNYKITELNSIFSSLIYRVFEISGMIIVLNEENAQLCMQNNFIKLKQINQIVSQKQTQFDSDMQKKDKQYDNLNEKIAEKIKDIEIKAEDTKSTLIEELNDQQEKYSSEMKEKIVTLQSELDQKFNDYKDKLTHQSIENISSLKNDYEAFLHQLNRDWTLKKEQLNHEFQISLVKFEETTQKASIFNEKLFSRYNKMLIMEIRQNPGQINSYVPEIIENLEELIKNATKSDEEENLKLIFNELIAFQQNF